MSSLLGFKPDMWDYLALDAVLALVIVGLIFVVIILGLPGKNAVARKHPEAHASCPAAPNQPIRNADRTHQTPKWPPRQQHRSAPGAGGSFNTAPAKAIP
jgi:hypothetical protein